jgi:hypothetical protein
MSAKVTAWMNSSPMPGHWNTGLGDDGEGDQAAELQPVMVITGTSVFFSACRNGWRWFDRPRARGELDVVGAQHLEHFGAHQPHDQRELEDRQRHGRQHDVVPAFGAQQARCSTSRPSRVAAAEARETSPASPAKQQDQQDADQEKWAATRPAARSS